MSGLTRWTPRLVLVVAVIHLAYGGVFSWSVLVEMAAEGVVGTVSGAERGYAVWFLVAGIALLTLGALGTWAAKTTGRLPGALGWGLVAIGLFVSLTEPASGGWLVLVLGVLALVAARRARTPVNG